MTGNVHNYEIRAACCTIESQEEFLQKIREISGASGVHIICFNADMVAGKSHVAAAVKRAERSFGSGYPISNSIEMEALLYAAGTRQTSVGSLFGLHIGENRLYICCLPLNTKVWITLSMLMHFCDCDDPWGFIDAKKQENLMKLFHISELEFSTIHDCDLQKLVLERVALLDVNK